MSLRKFLYNATFRRKMLTLVSTLLIGAVLLAACSTPAATATPPALTETPQIPTMTETPLVEATPTVAQPESQIDRLIFEREIPQLTQEEMAKIVGKSLRLHYSGVLFPLGYVGMSSDIAFFYGVVTDVEKATNQVDGNDWWRVLMITEIQKAELGGRDEGQYIFMPIYLCGKKNLTFSYDHARGGSVNLENSTWLTAEAMAEKLEEAMQKYGTFQIRADVFFTSLPDTVEYLKTTKQWELVKDIVMESSYGSAVTEAYTMAIIKKDYASLSEIMQNNPPKFLLSGFIIP